MGLQIVTTDKYGYYIWQVNGHPVGDEEGRYMLITSAKGDRKKIEQLTAAAHYYGVFENGEAVFCEGRPVSDEEYDQQVERMNAGLVPDPLESNLVV